MNKGSEKKGRNPEEIEANLEQIWQDLFVPWTKIAKYIAQHLYYLRKIEAEEPGLQINRQKQKNLVVINIFIEENDLPKLFEVCCNSYTRQIVEEEMIIVLRDATNEVLNNNHMIVNSGYVKEIELQRGFNLFTSFTPKH